MHVTYMLVVPHFCQDGEAVVCRILPCGSCVESWPGAAKEWNATVLRIENVSKLGVRVRSAIRWFDPSLGEPIKGGEPLVVLDCRLEEVHNILMLTVQGPVTRDIDWW